LLAILYAIQKRYKIPTNFKTVKTSGNFSNKAPIPSPTIKTIRGNPKNIPDMCGIVLLYPKVSPEDKSIMLFGPGDIEVDKVNVAMDKIIAMV